MEGYELTASLTPQEKLRKNQLEAKIKIHLRSFNEAGEALCEMRDNRLYRDEFPTFEQYCDVKWGFSDRRARQLIFASKVVGQLESGTMVPIVTERAIREFAAVKPDEYQPTWEQVVEASKGGKISATLVRRVIKAATGAAIEIMQTQGNVTIEQDSIPLVEATVTERIAEAQSRQIQHIADGSDWDRRATFTCTVSEASETLEQKLIGLGSGTEIKISIYTRK